jgi:glycine/D-amino acid oxidase-like deaminating enzyme
MHTDVGALRPDAALRARHRDIELSAPIHVSVTSAYALYIPIAGGVAPAQVVARLRRAALAIGADDVVDIETSTSCDRGLSVLRYLAGWVTTEARGTAVRYRRPAP